MEAILYAYNGGMEDATALSAAPAVGSMRTRMIQAVVLAYQITAALTFAAVPFLTNSWLTASYITGLAYLGAGLWIARVRPNEPSSMPLAIFTASSAIALGSSSAIASSAGIFVLWTLALGLCGGAVLHLSMVFPDEWPLVTRHPFITSTGYLLGVALAGYGLITPGSQTGVGYVVLSVLVFLGGMARRRFKATSLSFPGNQPVCFSHGASDPGQICIFANDA